ncbi:5923_t:CDS:2 [Dentiscutata erythropus]|uniref:5923_t:CDS:1 n=1 Tax=Dentiscutata erythropus TaxID=1348616 RepID=A0A9N9P0W6_9GLOM|nr:5923_t:CDS:2 [Dentiscutata erythropus]
MQSTEAKDCNEKLVNKSKRTTSACTECRNSKKKCDDEKPCSRCTKKNLFCETADMCKNCRYRRYAIKGMLYCKKCTEELGLETTQVNTNNYDTVSGPNILLYEHDYSIVVDVSLEGYDNTMNLQYADMPLEEYDNTMNQIFFSSLNE